MERPTRTSSITIFTVLGLLLLLVTYVLSYPLYCRYRYGKDPEPVYSDFGHSEYVTEPEPAILFRPIEAAMDAWTPVGHGVRWLAERVGAHHAVTELGIHRAMKRAIRRTLLPTGPVAWPTCEAK
jgi:hypothetical protein